MAQLEIHYMTSCLSYSLDLYIYSSIDFYKIGVNFEKFMSAKKYPTCVGKLTYLRASY